MKDVFVKAVTIAATHRGVTRSTTGWKLNINRLRKEYGAYVAKLK